MRCTNTVLCALLSTLLPVAAQSDVGKAVRVKRHGVTIQVGRDGTYSSEYDHPESLRAENANIDTLIEHLVRELLVVQPTDSARAWVRKEHKLWLKERCEQCRREGRSVPRDRRTRREQGCRKWAGVWRLEELLIRYDALAP